MTGNTLQYVFNKKLIPNEENIKKQFQKLFCENCDDVNACTKTLSVQGKKVFETIWGNVGTNGSNGLRQGVFSNRDKTDSEKYFTEVLVPNINSSLLYGFIKSR